ncbi:MAG: hypothetical protein IPJ53_00140 [Saprospiraceae bacterium]|nr:hypothetical protein [Candidatus Vicinibacter affinis]
MEWHLCKLGGGLPKSWLLLRTLKETAVVLLGQSDDSGHIKVDTQLFQFNSIGDSWRPNGRA